MIKQPAISHVRKEATNRNNYIKEVLQDLWYCLISREASLLGRKEVLTGKAKFGIFGDGKEVPQVAMSRVFKKGDWRSGYYRDQTLMLASGICSIEEFFAQLYADSENDPFSGGRQMNSHYATPNYDQETGEWISQTNQHNVSADVSCTAGQMGRSLGLAMASVKFRELPSLNNIANFSHEGNEICFCTIGDASTSEGSFWETMNAAVVHKVPLLVAVWDDGFGISVPVEEQTAKASISRAMEGLLLDEHGEGMHIYAVKGWDYPALVETFEKATNRIREKHRPVLVHVQELTQPQGHSTSGSHERYKSKERLAWERDHDCNERMIQWILQNGLTTADKIAEMRQKAKAYVKDAKLKAWRKLTSNLSIHKKTLLGELENYLDIPEVVTLANELKKTINPFYSEMVQVARRLALLLNNYGKPISEDLQSFLERAKVIAHQRYHTHLLSEGPKSVLNVPVIPATYDGDAQKINGYQILNKYFQAVFAKNDKLLAFGEDVGRIGDVNQGFAGLQKIFGKERIFDTGIREWTIMGQAIGLALRGFRPIAEIQYLDYLVYGLSPLTDDLASLRYRSNGIQRAPVIVRSRGHRLEGIWHAGSPMGMLLSSLRGMILAVPRNMVQAAGMYNTLLNSDDPALVVECLNGYRLKEALPHNIAEFTVPVGLPEILQEGKDITLVTYGSCIREAQKGIELLKTTGIEVELIDVQTLMPFDLEHVIANSLRKTNKVIFLDEDVPGGATAYMMQQVLEKHGGFQYLDAAPVCLTAKAHRPAFGSDGDYFSKPNPEDIAEQIISMMKEYNPHNY